MKKKFKLAVLALLALCVSAGAACGGAEKTSQSAPPTQSGSALENRTVRLDRETLELDRFGEATLLAEMQGEGTLEWSSSDETVVKVTAGKLEATGAGAASITVKIVGTNISDSCAVTVTEATELPLLTLDKPSVSVLKGGSLTVVPSVTYRGQTIAEGVAYAWKIDDETVAAVANGVVTGVRVGTAYLSVQAIWKGEKLTRTVPVAVNADASVAIADAEDNAVSRVTLRSSLPEGVDPSYIDEIRLTATPYEKGEKGEGTVAWSLVSGDAVSVSDGLVSAVKPGEAVVRAQYVTTEGDAVYTDVAVSVVLPDVDTPAVFEADKTDPAAALDFTSVSDKTVTGMKHRGTEILDDGKLDEDWLALQKDGEFEVEIFTADVVYNAKLLIFSRYLSPQLGDASRLNIVESTGNKPLGGIWDAADENDAALVGDTAGVYRYKLTGGVAVGAAFSYRVEILPSDYTGEFAGYNDYIVFDAFVPEGEPGIGGWGKTIQDIWFDWLVGKELAADKGFYVGADGVKTNVLRAGEWMTVVLPAGKIGLTRFGWMSAGGKDAAYYMKDMRMYSQARWDTAYLTQPLAEIVLERGGMYEISADDFPSLYVGAEKTDAVSEITLSVADSSVVTLAGTVVTAAEAGSATVNVTARVGRVTFATLVNVVVAQAVSPVEIDRASTGTLTSPEIEGSIEKVECEGALIAESADVSAWLKGLAECSLGAVEKRLIVTTDRNVYAITVRVRDTKDYIDRSRFVVVSSGGAASLWTHTDAFEGKNDVYRYRSAKADGTAAGISVWNTRVEFNNAVLYGKYDYMAAEIYVPQGASFGFFFGQSGGGVFVLEEGSVIGESNAYPYAFDAEGKKMETFKEGQWVTIIVPVSMMIEQRCAFGQKDGEAYEYYVGEMKLYTRENLENAFDIPKLNAKVLIDKSDASVFKVIDNKGLAPWTAEASFEGKENVYRYSSDKGDGTADGITIWDTRVDFKNNEVYSLYAYMTVEVFVTQGSAFAMFLGGPAGSVHSLTDGSALGTPAYAYAFDAAGNKLEAFKTGEWVTVVVPTSIMTVNRCAFAQADNALVDYRVGEMCLYTQESFDAAFRV